MAAGSSGSDDASMAAALKNQPQHMAPKVGQRKERRFKAWMRQFAGGLTGTAAFRRRKRRS